MQEAPKNPKQMQCTVSSNLTCLSKILRAGLTVAETKTVKFYSAVRNVLRYTKTFSKLHKMYTNSIYIIDKSVKHQIFTCEKKKKMQTAFSVTRITLNG
jgi:uncharacterized protein with PIN domain